jgi:DNA-binding response OmpR family regulator
MRDPAMNPRAYRILLIEPDPGIVEMLVASVSRRFDARVTCVRDGASGLDFDLAEPQDLVITEHALPDGSGLDLAEKLLAVSGRPVIMLVDKASFRDAVAALRLGVTDVFHKPFDVTAMLEAAERALDGFELRRRTAVRHRYLRELVRRMIRERRDLNHRMELVCRDLVGSHRRLVDRVLTLESRTTAPHS